MSSPSRSHPLARIASLSALLVISHIGLARAGDPEPKQTQQFSEGGGASPELRDEQIKFLEKLLEATEQSDPDYPDFLFRLADRYIEKKSYLEQRAHALDEQIFAAQSDAKPDLVRALTATQAGHLRKAKAASEAATQAYRALVDNPAFAAYKRMDEALYIYAVELGDEQQMRAAHLRLIKDFPRSPYVPHAYLSFADHYFGKGELATAVGFYEQVTQFPNSPVYAYALYKLGWCHLNPIGQLDARHDQSLEFFVATINATKEGRAGSEAAGKQLRREARRDLVRAYVHVGAPEKAWAFFQKIGDGPGQDEQHAREMLELLAAQYFDEGSYTESTVINQQLQALAVDDEAR